MFQAVPHALGLIVSKSCNLNCSYCYATQKDGRQMDLQTAKDAVTAFMSDGGNETARIDFMGGEPLTAFPLICEICEWVWAGPWKDRVYFFITTNGTLLSPEMKQWFFQHRNKIILSLSYDGDHAQTRNRSSKPVELSFFRETWPNQPVKLTIAEQSVGFLAEDVAALHRCGSRLVATFEMGAPAWSRESVDEFGRQMEQLTDFYCEHTNIDMLHDFDIHLSRMFSEDTHRMHCGIGGKFRVVDPSGGTYPCQMMSPLALTNDELDRALKDTGELKHTVEKCAGCVLDPICPICYSMSFKRFGDPFVREPNICRLFQLHILYAAKYVIRTVTRKPELTYEDRLNAQAAAMLLKDFPQAVLSVL